MSADESSATCIACHKSDNKRSHWDGSTHQTRDVTCASCHSVHAAKDKVLAKLTQPEVCFTCHKSQRAELNRPSRHPILEGKVSCADCHNPHGSVGPKLMKKDSTVETCYQCHAEKRGPFVHNHEPVQEDCGNCHSPHGSVVDSLLKMRQPMLCHSCHTPHGGAGPPGDGAGQQQPHRHVGRQGRRQHHPGTGLRELPYAGAWRQQPECDQSSRAVHAPLKGRTTMKTSEQRLRFCHTAIALAVLGAFGQAQAQEAAAPQSWVSVGGTYVNGDPADHARWSVYNGMREDSGYGILDFLYSNRDPAAGLWTSIEGRNLFLDNRELNFTIRKLGDWKIVADYSEIIRSSPYTINTSLQGAGSTAPTVSRLATPGTGQDMYTETQRKGISLYGSKWFGGAVQFEAGIKSEDKDGSRMFGKGFACSASWVSAGSCATSTTQWALLFTPEPIDSTINQAEAKLTYAKDNLLLTAGYYGNIYINRNSNLTPNVTGTSLNNPLGVATALDSGLRTTLDLPLALPPDSQSHQFYLLGQLPLHADDGGELQVRLHDRRRRTRTSGPPASSRRPPACPMPTRR